MIFWTGQNTRPTGNGRDRTEPAQGREQNQNQPASPGNRITKPPALSRPLSRQRSKSRGQIDQEYEKPSVTQMSLQVIGDETTLPEAVKDFQQIINSVADSTTDISSLERFAFNEKAKSTFAIVATEDTRLYVNLILTKGIMAP
jgi:hypothetical protein